MQFQDQTETIQRIGLGIFQSDQAGYLSIDLKGLEKNLNVVNIWIYSLTDETVKVDALPSLLFDFEPTIVILKIPDRIPTNPERQLPSISSTYADPTDSEVSPNSFATQPQLSVGEAGCEIFLHSSVAERTFRFGHLMLDNTPPDILKHVSSERNTKPKTGQGLFGTFFTTSDPKQETNENEATTYRLGVLLEYEMCWIPIGHALGELAYSLPLAPCESVKIAVVDWSRTDTALRQESQEIRELLSNEQGHDRLIEESMKASLHEWQRGGSVSAGVSIPIYAALVSAGGGYSTTSADRKAAAKNVQRLSDSIVQATSFVRSKYNTVIVQASQAEQDAVQTRVVTNHNHCHAMTVLYYEVLRRYRVVTKFVDATDVILIRFPVESFTATKALCYRSFIEPALLEPKLGGCFDALMRITYGAETLDSSEEDNATALTVDRFTVHVTTGSDDDDEGPDDNVVKFVYLDGKTGEEYPKDMNWNVPGTWAPGSVHTGRFELSEPIPVEQIEDIGIYLDYEDDWGMTGLRVDVHFSDGHSEKLFETPEDFRHKFRNSSYYWASTDGFQPHQTEINTEEADRIARLKAMDEACKDMLLAHLNCHKMYYHRVIWLSQDPGDRARLFDDIYYNGGRLLEYIDNRPVGVVGDYIAFPLNTSDVVEKLIEVPEESKQVGVRFISLPTRGVFAEAKLSNCNSCEERDITRFWDWSESPCPDQAPGISDVSLGSRARDIDTTPSEMPSPVVNIVNPPNVPDPTGMAAALQLLGTQNIFRDMSMSQEVSSLLRDLVSGSVTLEQAQIRADQIRNKQSATGSTQSEQKPTARETHERQNVIDSLDLDPEVRQNLTEENANQMITGTPEGASQSASSQPTRRSENRPSPRGRTVQVILNAFYENGAPFYGDFEFNLDGPNQETANFLISVVDGRAGNTYYSLAPGIWSFGGRVIRTRLPDTLNQSLPITLPSPLPNISIPLSEHLTTIDEFRHTGYFEIPPRASQIVLRSTAKLQNHPFSWEINISTSAGAGVSPELQVKQDLQAGIEAAIDELVSIALGQTLGLAGTIGVNLSGTFELGGRVSAQFEYTTVSAIETVQVES
ncbi:hypothetical protein FBQ99_20560 [Chloroflexi bacterium CFX2]|nr:hypothetical protein [Chloroflexi bacterium CFX2]